MKTIVKELSVVNTKELTDWIYNLHSASAGAIPLWYLEESISNLLIPAEKFARQCIQFGEDTRTANTVIDDVGFYHLSSKEIVDDFINNGKIIL